jgi:hypothetical protein
VNVRRSTSPAWWSDLVKAALLSALIATAVGVAGVRAGEKTPGNIDLMQQLTAQVINELYGKFGPSLKGHAVQLKPAATTEEYTFVTNVFREELTKLGVTVIDPSTPLAVPLGMSSSATTPAQTTTGQNPAGTFPTQGAPATQMSSPTPRDSAVTSRAFVLQYQNVVFDLKYVDSHRSFVVGGKRVDRRAAVRIMTTLTDTADSRVVWVGEAARDHSDEIDYGDAALIEQGTYAFNKPVVPSAGWGHYVEPVFVTGIIVGLIYLFFSNQSNN